MQNFEMDIWTYVHIYATKPWIDYNLRVDEPRKK